MFLKRSVELCSALEDGVRTTAATMKKHVEAMGGEVGREGREGERKRRMEEGRGGGREGVSE